jgi:DNA ligase D-like protein (predicted 3'-phosphoesterase)
MQVEDHPLGWGEFEGVIEEGSYGAGAVIVWDSGWYENLSDGLSMDEALRRGHARVWLHGQKLRGGYTLRRTSGGAKPKWLLMKRRDAEADARRNPVATQPESVLSGRTVEEVAAEGRRG